MTIERGYSLASLGIKAQDDISCKGGQLMFMNPVTPTYTCPPPPSPPLPEDQGGQVSIANPPKFLGWGARAQHEKQELVLDLSSIEDQHGPIIWIAGKQLVFSLKSCDTLSLSYPPGLTQGIGLFRCKRRTELR